MVSINEVVRQVMELQQVSLAQEKINVALDLDPACPWCTATRDNCSRC